MTKTSSTTGTRDQIEVIQNLCTSLEELLDIMYDGRMDSLSEEEERTAKDADKALDAARKLLAQLTAPTPVKFTAAE
jgi:hypothetical protein